MDFRHKIFFGLAAAALLLAAARQVYLAGPGGAARRAEAEKAARFEGELSAIRGRIYDASGRLAAWSVRCYDLVWNASPDSEPDPAREIEIRNILVRTFGPDFVADRKFEPGMVIKYDLTMHELELADAISTRYPELDAILRWERRHDDDGIFPGEVRQENGSETGISGAEAEFNAMLRGVPGRYTVMLDRQGRWLDATFRILTPPQPGKDIHLPAGYNNIPENHEP